MANIRIFKKFNFVSISTNLTLNRTRHVVHCQTCSIFCNKTLGIDEYINKRKVTALQYKGIENKFLEKLSVLADLNTNDLIFTEDLKHVIHLAEEKDIELVKNLITKFSKQNSQLRFGNYIFGPVIIRLFHFLNKPIDALNVYNDERYNLFFDNLSSHLILTDLLFNNGLYESVIKVYYSLRSKQLLFGKYPRAIMVYVFGAYYKLNTSEHYDHAKKLWNEMNDNGATSMVRTMLIVANFALKYKEPQFALDVISASPRINENIKTIKILAFLGQNKTDEALQLMQSVLLIDNPYKKKEMFNYDVISEIKDFITKTNQHELITKFNRIESQLQIHGHINDETFESYLFSKLSYDFSRSDEVVTATFSNQNYRKKSRPRLGLNDMV